MKSVALFLLDKALGLLLKELWAFIKESVATMERSDLNRARAAGLGLSQSLINLGVEAALQVVRSKATA